MVAVAERGLDGKPVKTEFRGGREEALPSAQARFDVQGASPDSGFLNRVRWFDSGRGH